MSVGPLSGNWLLYQTLMNTALLNRGDQTSHTSLLNNSFESLIEQALLQIATPTMGAQSSSVPTLPPNGINTFNLDSLHFAAGPFQMEPVSLQTKSLGYRDINEEALNHHLKGALQNKASMFIEAGKRYHIDPALLASISMHETGNGTSAAARIKHNVAGMMGKNGLKTYASIQESIFDMARNLRENYLNEGKTTIAKIGAKYAPIGAAMTLVI